MSANPPLLQPPESNRLKLATPYLVGYTRVSSREQVDGYSLDAQQRAIQNFAASEKLTLVEVCSDPGRSGGSIKGRRGFARMLELVLGGQIGAVVAWRLDRLGRNIVVDRDLCTELSRVGCHLITLSPFMVRNPTDVSPHHQLNHNIQVMFAENERRQTRERILPALVTAFDQHGRRGGRTPLGYVKLPDGHFAVHPEEAAVVRRWFETVAGGIPITALVQTLASEKLQNRFGKSYTIDQVRGTLRNSFLIGELSYVKPKGTERAGARDVHTSHHEGIIPKELFSRVQLRLQPRKKSSTAENVSALSRSTLRLRLVPDLLQQMSRPHQHPVHGIIPPSHAKCATCGGTLYAVLQTRGGKGCRYRVPTYLCHVHKQFGPDSCRQGPALVADVDAHVKTFLQKEFIQGRWSSLVAGPSPVVIKPGELSDALERCARLDQAIEHFSGTVPPTLLERKNLLDETITRLREREAMNTTSFHMPPGPVQKCLENFDTHWEVLTLAERRDVVAWACTRVVIARHDPPLVTCAEVVQPGPI